MPWRHLVNAVKSFYQPMQQPLFAVVCPDAPIVSVLLSSAVDVPVVITSPLIVIENSTLALSCAVDAYPPVALTNVTWLKDDVIVGLLIYGKLNRTQKLIIFTFIFMHPEIGMHS